MHRPTDALSFRHGTPSCWWFSMWGRSKFSPNAASLAQEEEGGGGDGGGGGGGGGVAAAAAAAAATVAVGVDAKGLLPNDTVLFSSSPSSHEFVRSSNLETLFLSGTGSSNGTDHELR